MKIIAVGDLPEELPLPGEIDDISKLIEYGVRKTYEPGHPLEGHVTPINGYFERALLLIEQNNIENVDLEHKANFYLGIFHASWLRKEEAIPYVERGAELKPEDIKTRETLAKLYRETGEHYKSADQHMIISKLAGLFSIKGYTNLYNAMIQFSEASKQKTVEVH